MIAQRVLVNTLEHFRSFPAAGFADVLIRHALSVEFRRPIMPELVEWERRDVNLVACAVEIPGQGVRLDAEVLPSACFSDHSCRQRAEPIARLCFRRLDDYIPQLVLHSRLVYPDTEIGEIVRSQSAGKSLCILKERLRAIVLIKDLRSL